MRTLKNMLALASALAVTSVATLGAIPAPNPANSFAIQFSSVYTGDTPTLSPPWAVANFLDNDAVGAEDNQVWLAIGAVNLNPSEFFSKAFFNYEPKAGYAAAPTFAQVDQIGAVVTATVNPYSLNAYNAGANYKFDYELDYPTANVPGRFQDNEWALYSITGPAGSKVSALDFLKFSVKGNQEGPIAALHFQGLLPNDGSAWLAGTPSDLTPVPFVVPEPSTYAMLAGLGLLGFAGYRRFKK